MFCRLEGRYCSSPAAHLDSRNFLLLLSPNWYIRLTLSLCTVIDHYNQPYVWSNRMMTENPNRRYDIYVYEKLLPAFPHLIILIIVIIDYVSPFEVFLRFRASRFPSRRSGRSAAPTPSRSLLRRPWQLVPSARSDRDKIERITTATWLNFYKA